MKNLVCFEKKLRAFNNDFEKLLESNKSLVKDDKDKGMKWIDRTIYL